MKKYLLTLICLLLTCVAYAETKTWGFEQTTADPPSATIPKDLDDKTFPFEFDAYSSDDKATWSINYTEYSSGSNGIYTQKNNTKYVQIGGKTNKKMYN